MKRLSIALLFMLALLSRGGAQTAPSLNMTLFDHLDPVRADSVGEHSALWGYTAPDGREYALFGSAIGTHIIDITEKPIRQVAFIPGPTTPWREIKVYKQYAYVVDDRVGLGLQIIDLSGLPAKATEVNEDTTFFHTAHTVYIRDHYLYAMGTPPETGVNRGALILDLEPDPVHPRKVGAVTNCYYHDAFVRNDTLLGSGIYDGHGCDIYDIRDKANPVHLATITYPFSGTHNAELTPDGGYVVTTDEIGFTQKTMKVWDIHDLNNIAKVAEFTPNYADIVHNVHFRGRYALMAWYTAGVRIVDMIDPRHPREVGFYDTYPGLSNYMNGVWEVFGAFPSKKIIASDRQTGLYVLEFNDATAGSISGVIRNASTNAPMPDVKVVIPETGVAVSSDASGRYYVGGIEGTHLTLGTHEFGYTGTSEGFTIAGDKTHDISLSPVPFVPGVIVARDEQGRPITDFSWAIEPYLHSAGSVAGGASLQLPRDSTFTIAVGKWGYANQTVNGSFAASGDTLKVTLKRRYQDDATLDLGWSFAAPDDSATTGRWVRIIPYLGYPNSEWFYPPTEPYDGKGYVFETGAPLRDDVPQKGDVNNGQTTLTSPRMDLTDHLNPRINYHLWFVHYENNMVRDTMLVQLSNDDGATWTTAIAKVRGREQWNWTRDTIYPKQILPITDRMRIRFRVSDVKGDALVYAAMDNFDVSMNGEIASAPETVAGPANDLAMSIAPNPLRGGGTLSLRREGMGGAVRVELFDPLGRLVATLHDGEIGAGRLDLPIGDDLPSGGYVIMAIGRNGSVSSLPVRIIH
ncbi:MAG: repeat protein [Chlorobi bacterium]|nr:repeat protein [Chlorobiota bacterium]